mmetsp:Transcript_20529/g.20806  ORF Transcript_20529/g.20806 Transcript_20529/m.20806 type:complete len:150 (-) Transcript_20529:545-994(-)
MDYYPRLGTFLCSFLLIIIYIVVLHFIENSNISIFYPLNRAAKCGGGRLANTSSPFLSRYSAKVVCRSARYVSCKNDSWGFPPTFSTDSKQCRKYISNGKIPESCDKCQTLGILLGFIVLITSGMAASCDATQITPSPAGCATDSTLFP